MARAPKRPLGLTERQCEVMSALIRLGCAKLVAAELGVASRTVDDIIRAAMRRMGARTRLQAALAWDRQARPSVKAARSVFEQGAAQ